MNDTFRVEMKKGDNLIISAENIDEQMITAIDNVPTNFPSCREQVYDLSGRCYSTTAGRFGIHVVNGHKKVLR